MPSASLCMTPKRPCGLPASSISGNSTGRSRCGPARASSRTSAPTLLSRISGEAPGVRLHFLHKLDKDSGPLRDGSVDLETGVVDKAIGPEVLAQALFRDRYVGVVRVGHPLSEGDITPARFAAARHVHVSRRDSDKGPIDDALAGMGLHRQIATTVGGFAAALALVRPTDWVACVHERHTGVLYAGMHSFALPVPVAPFTVSLLWHPRLHGDPAHRWLRGCVRGVCAERLTGFAFFIKLA